MTLSIIVLTFNNLPVTVDCVESIYAHTAGDFELIAVDNGSRDGTPAYAPRFDYVEAFSGGMALVRKDGEEFYIDQDGNRV